MSILDDYDYEVERERIRGYYQEEWIETNEAYTASPQSFYAAFTWLSKHPIFNTPEGDSYFQQALDIEVYLTNDKGFIDSDQPKNINTKICLECGPIHLKSDAPEGFFDERKLEVDYLGVFCGTHDYQLDCTGDSFEAAIIRLARLVKTQYGTDRSNVYRDR